MSISVAGNFLGKKGKFKGLRVYRISEETYQLIEEVRDEEENYYVKRTYGYLDMLGLLSLIYHRLEKLKKSVDGLPRRVPMRYLVSPTPGLAIPSLGKRLAKELHKESIEMYRRIGHTNRREIDNRGRRGSSS